MKKGDEKEGSRANKPTIFYLVLREKELFAAIRSILSTTPDWLNSVPWLMMTVNPKNRSLTVRWTPASGPYVLICLASASSWQQHTKVFLAYRAKVCMQINVGRKRAICINGASWKHFPHRFHQRERYFTIHAKKGPPRVVLLCMIDSI